MTTTPSPALPQTCAPPSHPSTHCRSFSQGRAHQSPGQATPATGPKQPDLRLPQPPQSTQSTSSCLFPQPTRPTRPTPTNCKVRNTRPTRSPSHQPGLPHPSAPSPPDPGPEQPDLRPASLAPARSPSRIIPGQAHAYSQILTFRPLPIKPHVIFIGKGRFCLYLCHACICTLPVNTNIPGTHWGHRGYQLKINQFT